MNLAIILRRRILKTWKRLFGEMAGLLTAIFGFITALGVLGGMKQACGEVVTLKAPKSGTEIQVRVGDLVRIELEELGSAGYLWELRGLDAEYLVLSGSHTERPTYGTHLIGGPVLRIFEIKAEKKGESKIHFIRYRPWEGEEKAVEEIVIRVRIQ